MKKIISRKEARSKEARSKEAKFKKRGWTKSVLGNWLPPYCAIPYLPYCRRMTATPEALQEITGYWVFFKNGMPRYFIENPRTKLKQCEICGHRSTPKKIFERRRGWLSREDDFEPGILCMGCWNKVRPLDRVKDNVRENMYLINKLKRTANDSQEHRRTQEVAG